MFKTRFALTVVAVSCLLLSPYAAAQAQKLKIEMEITRDGKSESKPTLVVEAGKSAKLEVGKADSPDFKLDIKAELADSDQVSLDIKIESRLSDGKMASSNPKLKAALGASSSLGIETDSGADVEFTIKVTKP